MSDRGSYRSTYEALADDLDFQRLSFAAQAVFHSLKLKLGQYGIAVFYHQVLYSLHQRHAPAEIDAALAELEAPKPGRPFGWVRREAHVLWVVNACRYEPSVTLANGNHRAGATKYAKTLPQLAIVREFMAYYGLDAPATKPPASPTLPHPDPIPMGSPIPGGITETETERETETETEIESEKGSLPGESAAPPTAGSASSPAAQGSPTTIEDGSGAPSLARPPAVRDLPGVRALLSRHYGAREGVPLTDRAKDVLRQLERTLSGGAKRDRRTPIRAADPGHLDTACAEIATRPMQNPDAAIAVVFDRLAETLTEAVADAEARGRARGAAERVRALADASAWLDSIPGERGRVEGEVESAIPRREADANPGARIAREQLLNVAVLRAYHRRGVAHAA